jgi:DNA-damage-inducible protein J
MPNDIAATRNSSYKPNDTETYDEWFVRQVKEGLKEADDPNTVWLSNEEVFAAIEERRKEWRSRAEKQQVAA